MSVTLICGAPCAPLKLFHKVLVDCEILTEGRQDVGPLGSMAQWMERFFAKADTSTARQLRPGKAWEAAASEIFLKNIEASAWGWADTRNLALLDFWREFDPDIKFLMLLIPPEQYIAYAQLGSAEPQNNDVLLSEWKFATEAMLAFYYRHPSQAVLVDVRNWQLNPAAAARVLSQNLCLPAPVQAATPLTRPDHLLTWLARQITHADATVGVLWDTVRGLLPVGELESAFDAQAAIAMVREASIKLVKERKAQTAQLSKDKSALAASLEIANKEKAKLKAACDANVKLVKEREAQVAQLNKDKAALGSSWGIKIKGLEEENNLLLSQLHKVQEALEQYCIKQVEESKRADKFEKRFHKLLACYPHHVHWQELRSLAVRNDELFCQLLQLEVGASTLPAIALRAKMIDGRVVIRVQAVDQIALPWADGSVQDIEGQQLDLDALQFKNQLPFAQAQNLSATHWKICCSFPIVLQKALATSENLTTEWELGLKSLHAAMLAPQPLWRVDRVNLRNEEKIPGYEHLWLELHGAEFLGKSWPIFEFRLGAADVRAEGFSTHPRLEFPEGAEGPRQFEQWFPEAQDDFGRKFELRFEITNHDIDVAAWNKLSHSDHAIVASILQSLPQWLVSINKRQPLMRPAAEWVKLGHGALSVLAKFLEKRKRVQMA